MDYEKLGLFYLGRRIDTATGTVTDVPVLYDASDLVTHAVILGMTGSGKTGLGIGLIEEAAIDGLPVLADRSEGRPVEPPADVSASRRRPSSRRGSIPTRRGWPV